MKKTKINLEVIKQGSSILEQLENKHLNRTDKSALIVENAALIKSYHRERSKVGFKEGDAVRFQGQVYQVDMLWLRFVTLIGNELHVKAKSFSGETVSAIYTEFTKV